MYTHDVVCINKQHFPINLHNIQVINNLYLTNNYIFINNCKRQSCGNSRLKEETVIFL